jgi:hypothetical protein
MAKPRTKKKGRAAPELIPPRRVTRLDLRFLQALLLAGHSFAYISRQLENADLPPTTVEELTSIREALGAPKNLKPNAASHKSSADYIERVGVTAYFRNADAWREAVAILQSPKARELAEAALVADAPAAHLLAMLIAEAHHRGTSTAGLRLYEHFFFATGSVSRSELRLLVAARVRQGVLRVLGAAADSESVKQAVEADARTVAASLPTVALGWPSVKLAMGYDLPKLNLPKALDLVVNYAAIRSASMVLRGRDGDEQIAERYAAVLEKVTRVRASLNVPDDDLYNKLRRVQIRHDTSPVATAGDLRAAGGQVSTASNIPPDRSVLDDERALNDRNDEAGYTVGEIDPSRCNIA